MTKKENVLKAFLEESLNYRNFKDLESLIQDSANLENLPIWPLYFSLKEGTSDQLIEALPHLNQKQRQTLRDLETWSRDQMDVIEFDKWCVYIFRTQDFKVIKDLVTAKDFLVYLKGRFVITLFDQEDPIYPEHDNFFITDDDQFILEFDKNFTYVQEIKSLLKHFYAHYGVEMARDLLISLIPESFLGLQEESYINKRERLREIGHIDYYEALELKSIFTFKSLESFINKKIKSKYKVSESKATPNLGHYNKVVIPFHNRLGSIFEELEKITDPATHQYLLYNFSCLVNAQLILNDAFRSEKVQFNELGDRCRQRVSLGLSYLQYNYKDKFKDDSVLESFNFYDLYRIGNSLLMLVRKDLKKELEEFGHKINPLFLGDHWTVFVEDIFDNNFLLKRGKNSASVEDYETYQELLIRKNLLVSSMPIIKEFYKTVAEIRASKKKISLLNMNIEDFDFETLILTQFIRDSLNLDSKGYAVTLKSFWKFFDQVYLSEDLSDFINKFFAKYGLDSINNFSLWFKDILVENFEYLRSENREAVDSKFLSGVLLKA